MSQSVTQCWTMAELPGIDLTEGVDLGKGSVRPQVCNYNQVHVQTSLHIPYPKTMRTELGKTWESRRHGAKSPGVIACLATCSFRCRKRMFFVCFYERNWVMESYYSGSQLASYAKLETPGRLSR